MFYFKCFILLVCLGSFNLHALAGIQAGELVCEYHKDPVGIDVLKPRLSWQLLSDEEAVTQTAYEIRVASSVRNLKSKSKQVWNSGKIESAQSVNVVYGGPVPESGQLYYWQVRVWDNKGNASGWSEPAYWEMGILDASEWKAEWISMKDEKEGEMRPAQFFRNTFNTSKEIKSARVYVTSLGVYQLFINQRKISNDLFSPGWTSYNKRIQYQVYDVTDIISKQNAIGAILGDGWYRGQIGWVKPNNFYGDKLAFLLQLEIHFKDGTTETIISDENWKVSTGPILESSIYHGETYDARLEKTGWVDSDFVDSDWQGVEVTGHPKNMLVASQSGPVQGIQEIKPVKLITTPKGETVLDMGQNMTGWLRMNVSGKRGDKVVMSFAEVLDKDGNFYTENLRRAKATNTYILKGDDVETFEPHFTFHGFRYVKLEGYPGTPGLDDFTGVVIHSVMQPTGTFSSSDSLINQLQHNIQWGQKGNFLDVPTDCPQRDERLGWTGDAQVFFPTAAYNYNVAPFFTKWLKDLAVDQHANGFVPHVIPDVMLEWEGGSTAWADASVIIPWGMYQVYGDKRILEKQYESMQGWVEYMRTNAGNDYLWTEGQHFGDWLAYKAPNASDYTGATTEKDLIATAYFAHSSEVIAKAASVLGKEDDASRYLRLSDSIKSAFVKEFVTENGRLVSHTQTSYCLALAFDLLPGHLIPKAAAYLAQDVRKFRHLTTGFVGTPLLCKTLSDNGYEDLAFMLLSRREYPSWLYPITQGATTIWERWDGQKPDGTFQDASMNSFNHYAYGAIGEWMYSYIGGINVDPENPGYKHFVLSPHGGAGLTYANAEFISMYGKIKSAWKIEGDDFIYEISIPANTTATINLPGAESALVTINSVALEKKFKNGIEENENGVRLTLGSGDYRFEYPNKRK